MFHSVKECWLSASKHNMADVRELIPEFFYLPEFLVNSNNFDLGKFAVQNFFTGERSCHQVDETKRKRGKELTGCYFRC